LEVAGDYISDRLRAGVGSVAACTVLRTHWISVKTFALHRASPCRYIVVNAITPGGKYSTGKWLTEGLATTPSGTSKLAANDAIDEACIVPFNVAVGPLTVY
jgi:hypothetical protein